MTERGVCVVVPAHNEGTVIARLLRPLASAGLPIVVVANGCTDDTAEVAAGLGPAVQVIEMPSPSKAAAMRLGDHHAGGFPRLYVDADVEVSVASVHALAAALAQPGVLAAGPARALDLRGASRLVRWYYDVWTRLPSVMTGLYGRGVIAVNAAGHARLRELPLVMADDLAASLAFAESERVVADAATAVIRPPRTVRDLLRRRIRAATSVAEIAGRPDLPRPPRTGLRDLVRLTRSHPGLAAKVVWFAVMAILAKLGARRAIRRGDYTTWLRDQSSRRRS